MSIIVSGKATPSAAQAKIYIFFALSIGQWVNAGTQDAKGVTG
jgi:hypothetical protein